MTAVEGVDVLVVEDDPLVADVMVRRLVDAGYAVKWVSRGFAAVTQPARFAVVDLGLPDQSGLLVGEALASECLVEQVAFFTGGSDRRILERAADLGPVFFKVDGLGPLLEQLDAWRREPAMPRSGTRRRAVTQRPMPDKKLG